MMKINFFTAIFPYTNAEPFIENELPVIAKEVEGVNIFPYNHKDEINNRALPSNCKIAERVEQGHKLNISDYFLIFRILFAEFFLTQKKKYFLQHFRTWITLLKKAIVTSRFLSQIEDINKTNMCYSYWMDEWALALTVLKMRKKISKFVFRCGGFDIWDERSPGNYLPFRGVIYKYADGIFPNSKMAEVYLKEKKLFASKVQCLYWGTNDHGLAPFDSSAKFTMVSCSYTIPLKRVELIVEILRNMTTPVRWIHFGDGSEAEKIRLQCEDLRLRHEIEFTGFVPNQEVLQFYKKNVVHLFITTSSTEGLPVSLQEAISFGIPCVGTDVGGVKEVVNEETGILIPKDFDPAIVARQIETFRTSSQNTIDFRKNVRAYWERKFAANSNYTHFVNLLKSL